jgi:hypothetical protein
LKHFFAKDTKEIRKQKKKKKKRKENIKRPKGNGSAQNRNEPAAHFPRNPESVTSFPPHPH